MWIVDVGLHFHEKLKNKTKTTTKKTHRKRNKGRFISRYGHAEVLAAEPGTDKHKSAIGITRKKLLAQMKILGIAL